MLLRIRLRIQALPKGPSVSFGNCFRTYAVSPDMKLESYQPNNVLNGRGMLLTVTHSVIDPLSFHYRNNIGLALECQQTVERIPWRQTNEQPSCKSRQDPSLVRSYLSLQPHRLSHHQQSEKGDEEEGALHEEVQSILLIEHNQERKVTGIYGGLRKRFPPSGFWRDAFSFNCAFSRRTSSYIWRSRSNSLGGVIVSSSFWGSVWEVTVGRESTWAWAHSFCLSFESPTISMTTWNITLCAFSFRGDGSHLIGNCI